MLYIPLEIMFFCILLQFRPACLNDVTFFLFFLIMFATMINHSSKASFLHKIWTRCCSGHYTRKNRLWKETMAKHLRKYQEFCMIDVEARSYAFTHCKLGKILLTFAKLFDAHKILFHYALNLFYSYNNHSLIFYFMLCAIYVFLEALVFIFCFVSFFTEFWNAFYF